MPNRTPWRESPCQGVFSFTGEGRTRRRDGKSEGITAKGAKGAKGRGSTQRRDDATTGQGFLVFWFCGASGGLGLGWSGGLGDFWSGTIGLPQRQKSTAGSDGNVVKMALLVASSCKSQGDNSEGRKGRKGEGINTTTRRRDDATTRQRFLVFWFCGASGGLGLGWSGEFGYFLD